jgi:hypothetical protein
VKILLTLIILICSSSIVLGETYKWEDANGVHITDNASSIPEKYREKALAKARVGVAAPSPQIGVKLPQQDNSIPEREKQEEINRVNQERARIATETMKQQQLKDIAQQNKLMTQKALGSISSVVNNGLSIIISGLIMLGITEISFLFIAKYIATKNRWNTRRAILIAQLVWLPVAYLIAIQMLTSLSHVNDATIKPQTSERTITSP